MSVVKPTASINYLSNPMGIPAHDYVTYEYNGAGNVTKQTYKLGGSSGNTVAVIEYTYDAQNVLTAKERTS